MRHCGFPFLGLVLATLIPVDAADDIPQYENDIAPLLKRHCVKCHGPTKQEGELNLAAHPNLVRGGKTGPVIVPHDADASLLWQRVANDEMPPKMPLSAAEKLLLRRWITAGTPGLKPDPAATNAEHWSFRSFAQSATERQNDGPIRLPFTTRCVYCLGSVT